MRDERYLEVVEIESREVIHRVKVTDRSESAVDRILSGMLRNMRDGCFVRDTADAETEEAP